MSDGSLPLQTRLPNGGKSNQQTDNEYFRYASIRDGADGMSRLPRCLRSSKATGRPRFVRVNARSRTLPRKSVGYLLPVGTDVSDQHRPKAAQWLMSALAPILFSNSGLGVNSP